MEQPSWNSRRGTAAIEWVPFRNRSAEAEYFFDERNEEVGHYGLTLFGCFLLCSAQEISYVVKENISYYSQEINALDQYTKERWVHDINYPEGIADTRSEQKNGLKHMILMPILQGEIKYLLVNSVKKSVGVKDQQFE